MTEVETYRFRDGVAVYTGGTRYLTAEDARALGKALLRIARSVDSEPFTAAPSLSFRVPGHQHLPSFADLRSEAATIADSIKARVTIGESDFWAAFSHLCGMLERDPVTSPSEWAASTTRTATAVLERAEDSDPARVVAALLMLADRAKGRDLAEAARLVHGLFGTLLALRTGCARAEAAQRNIPATRRRPRALADLAAVKKAGDAAVILSRRIAEQRAQVRDLWLRGLPVPA